MVKMMKLLKPMKNLKNTNKDHCHYTRKFRGAAQSICKLRYKVTKKIPVVIRNAEYDILTL